MSVTIYDTAKIIGQDNICFGNPVIIDDFAFIYARKTVHIGNYVHIAAYASITGGEEVTLEDFSTLSWGARIFTGTDDFAGSGFGNSTVSEEYRNVRRAPVRLERFVIIGANSVILPGVTLGEGATVGANSSVTRDLAPWGVYLGNRRIGERDRNGVLANYAGFLASCQTYDKD